MDPLTHGLLGATIAQAAYGRRLGPASLVWGALGGMLPDVDVVAIATGPMGELLYHRGPTHALWFGPVVGTLIGYALWKRARARGAPGGRGDWIGLMVLTILAHPVLDAFTTYGTQLLWPISRHRFGFDGVAIIDPSHTLLLVAALLVGWRSGWGSRVACGAAWTALALSTAFLLYGVHLNTSAVARGKADLEARGVSVQRASAYPTLMQPFLRRLVVRSDDRVYVGWVSLWGRPPIEWRSFEPASGPAVEALRRSREGRIFEWFAMGQTAAQLMATPTGDVVELDDLRFGLPPTPREGLWALRAEVHRDGSLAGPPRRINRRPQASALELLEQIVLKTFGG